jgi:protein-tyrosine phosphatase
MDCQEIVPGLFLGSARASKDKEGLQKLGIKKIVNIAGKQHYPGHFEYLKAHFPDNEETNFEPFLKDIFSFIETSLQGECRVCHVTSLSGGQHVLVHCSGGVSRSPSVVMAFLIACRDMTYEEAFRLVKEKRRGIKPGLGFVEQLRQLEH